MIGKASTFIIMTRLLILFLVLASAFLSWQIVHRSSPFVRAWRPSTFKRRALGPLSVLDSGPPAIDSGSTVVLLHGLGATVEYFGDAYDGLARRHRVLIPDLLGFGGSLDEVRSDFGLEAHDEALKQALDVAHLSDSRMTIVAHSMGAAIALNFARVHVARVKRVVLVAPPIYRSAEDVRDAAKSFDRFSRLFLRNYDWARRLCRWNCEHRLLSGQVMAALAPRWPRAISTGASRQTWAAYRESFSALVLDMDWRTLISTEIDLTVVRGGLDDIGDDSYVSELFPTRARLMIPGGGHHIPISHPEVLYGLLEEEAM